MDAYMFLEVQVETIQTSVTAKKAYSITEFCLAHGISRATFYNLRKVGQAPKEMEDLGRRLISDEAAAQWRQQMEAS